MRSITYAGQTVITSDEVAEALIELTAAVAQRGHAEAVSIPICTPGKGAVDEAELVIGVGNDVLSAPAEWDGDEVELADGAAALRGHPLFPQKAHIVEREEISDVQRPGPRAFEDFDLDLDDIERA